MLPPKVGFRLRRTLSLSPAAHSERSATTNGIKTTKSVCHGKIPHAPTVQLSGRQLYGKGSRYLQKGRRDFRQASHRHSIHDSCRSDCRAHFAGVCHKPNRKERSKHLQSVVARPCPRKITGSSHPHAVHPAGKVLSLDGAFPPQRGRSSDIHNELLIRES